MKKRQSVGDAGPLSLYAEGFGRVSKARAMRRTRFAGGCGSSPRLIVGYATIAWQPMIWMPRAWNGWSRPDGPRNERRWWRSRTFRFRSGICVRSALCRLRSHRESIRSHRFLSGIAAIWPPSVVLSRVRYRSTCVSPKARLPQGKRSPYRRGVRIGKGSIARHLIVDTT
jgi:hypothetical protein